MQQPESFYEISWGEKPKPAYLIDRLQLTEKYEVITILTQPMVSNVVYLKELGYVYFTEELAKRGKRPFLKFNFIVAAWDKDKTGVVGKNAGYNLFYITVSEPDLKELNSLVSVNGDPVNLNIKISQSKVDGRNKNSYSLLGPSLLANNEALRSRVLEEVKELKPYLKNVVASSPTLDEIRTALGEVFSEDEENDFNSRMTSGVSDFSSGFEDTKTLESFLGSDEVYTSDSEPKEAFDASQDLDFEESGIGDDFLSSVNE